MFNFAFTLLASLTGNLASSMTPIVEADPAPPELWHHLSKRPLGEVPQGMEVAYFGMGCFWGAERLFWERPGVWSTAVGYGGGDKVSPSYRQVCEGRTGHAELVRVVFDPAQIRYEDLLSLFWQNHDPTQGNRQGNDRGHQYRSAIYATTPEQFNAARASRDTYQGRLSASGFGVITTELRERAPTFYFAEEEHQQYLAKDPQGYCALAGTGISCPDWVS